MIRYSFKFFCDILSKLNIGHRLSAADQKIKDNFFLNYGGLKIDFQANKFIDD